MDLEFDQYICHFVVSIMRCLLMDIGSWTWSGNRGNQCESMRQSNELLCHNTTVRVHTILLCLFLFLYCSFPSNSSTCTVVYILVQKRVRVRPTTRMYCTVLVPYTYTSRINRDETSQLYSQLSGKEYYTILQIDIVTHHCTSSYLGWVGSNGV